MTDLLVLINQNPDLPFADFALEPGEYVLGRSTLCDLPISDLTISRRHARLVVRDATIEVADLDSRNGTFIQGVRTTVGTVSVGHELRFGRIAFLVDKMNISAPVPDVPEGDTAILRQQPREASPSEGRPVLTPARQRVLACLLEGMTEKEASIRLGISRHTVHNHVREIYAQFLVRSRSELLAKYIPPPLESPTGSSSANSSRPSSWRTAVTQSDVDAIDLE